jgi:hypothetical protein
VTELIDVIAGPLFDEFEASDNGLDGGAKWPFDVPSNAHIQARQSFYALPVTWSERPPVYAQ